jgi:hypothetical protein
MSAFALIREVRSAAQLRRWLARLEGWAVCAFIDPSRLAEEARTSSDDGKAVTRG